MEAGTEYLKDEAVKLINAFRGIREAVVDLEMKSRHPEVDPNLITRAFSEAVQEGLVMRVEYTTPISGYMVNVFYLPQGSKIL